MLITRIELQNIKSYCDDVVSFTAGTNAICGENGAGKSTLAKIIAGIEYSDSGRMSVERNDYRPKSRKDAERRGVRIVMQELNLVGNLTVAENIFIQNLPSRFGFIDYATLNTAAHKITERVGLADIEPAAHVRELGVGQQQMVEIAAGLSQKCRILILDEPTSMVDTMTEKKIQEALARLVKGRTTFAIAHRLSTLRNANRLVVLDEGKLVEMGTHDELMEKGGTYRKLVDLQREMSHIKGIDG